jgi:hypothetical protein
VVADYDGSPIAGRRGVGHPARMSVPRLPLAVVAVACLMPGPIALARGGGGDGRQEVRVAATCSGGVSARLKVRQRDGGIDVEFELEHARRGSTWRMVVVQEGLVVARRTMHASRDSGAFQYERSLRDFAGADRISVRAEGRGGIGCRAAATLPGG